MNNKDSKGYFQYSTGICDRWTCGLADSMLDFNGYFVPFCGIGNDPEEAKLNLLNELNELETTENGELILTDNMMESCKMELKSIANSLFVEDMFQGQESFFSFLFKQRISPIQILTLQDYFQLIEKENYA